MTIRWYFCIWPRWFEECDSTFARGNFSEVCANPERKRRRDNRIGRVNNLNWWNPWFQHCEVQCITWKSVKQTFSSTVVVHFCYFACEALGMRWQGLSGTLLPSVLSNVRRAKAKGISGNMAGEGRLLGGLLVVGAGEAGVVFEHREAVRIRCAARVEKQRLSLLLQNFLVVSDILLTPLYVQNLFEHEENASEQLQCSNLTHLICSVPPPQPFFKSGIRQPRKHGGHYEGRRFCIKNVGLVTTSAWTDPERWSVAEATPCKQLTTGGCGTCIRPGIAPPICVTRRVHRSRGTGLYAVLICLGSFFTSLRCWCFR